MTGMHRKIASAALGLALSAALGFAGCGSNHVASSGSNTLYVYNWGEYIDKTVIDDFEKETGIHVVYDEFETNEVMYPKIDADPSCYDVVCPSDYMIAKMAQNNLLAPLDYSKIPHAKNIGRKYYEQAEAFDPGNKYSIPYTWGTIGILYNTKMIHEKVDSWKILWDKKYNDNILMQDSVRDLFAVGEAIYGYSLNTTDKGDLEKVRDLLIRQKPLVQAYVVDEVRDKMISGESALGVIYSGEAEFTREENPDLAYAIPKEGTNIWIDAWVIPRGSKHKEAAYKWLDFLCRGDIALRNFEEIYYSTPNTAAMELMDEETRNNKVLFPDLTGIKLEAYNYLGPEAEDLYFELWKEIKSA